MSKTKKVLTRSQRIAKRVEDNGLGNLRQLGFSDTAILIIGILEKLFVKYPNGFDKHTEDRIDQQYLDGECWVKELGIDGGTFKKYFGEIGIIFKSPQEYLEAEKQFEGKPYCSVLNTLNHHRTMYYRNLEPARIIEAYLTADYSVPGQETGLELNK